MIKLLSFCIAFVLCIHHATLLADDANIEFIFGNVQQGNLIIAQTHPSNSIIIQGRQVKLDAKGRFVFGLGRDAQDDLFIEIHKPDNTTVRETFKIDTRQYSVQKITGVDQKYVTPPDDVLKRIQQDNADVALARKSSKAEPSFLNSGFAWPAKGPISGVYGSQRVFNGVPKRPHFGLDIAGPVGTPVVAPAAGVVTLVNPDMYYSGGTLIIDHGFGISSTFIHLSKIHVAVGQEVKQGELIADIGATGRVTGPHLDWRVNWYDERLDPQLLLSLQ